MKNLKKKLSLQQPKGKQPEKEIKAKPQPSSQIPERIHTEINSNFAQKSSSDWKREREFLFSKIKTLEREVNSLKSKNQELQIQLTLTSTEYKQSFVTTTNENLKIQKKRRIDHKRIYSEMFTSYRKKKFKQNSEDSRSGIGVLKQQLANQKPKSFGEGTKGIIGNKILSNIIKEFRIDLQEQKKLEKNYGENNNKNGLISNNNTINNTQNNKIKKVNNNKFMKNLTTKINNNYPMKKVKNNNNAFPKKKLNRIQITDNNENNTFNNINKKISETMNNTENISLVDDIDNKTCSQTKNDLSNDLNGDIMVSMIFQKNIIMK